jgi:two-component sensor histidine kinase
MLPMASADSAYLKIFRDRTLERTAEARRALLVDELNHRVKNTLATVQSIASQTFRSTDSPKAFMEALQTRLFAISRAHDLLTRESWAGANLADVAHAALEPWLEGGRITMSGPPVRLRSQHALALSMALNELATNAVKYGALSVPAGRVGIAWRHDDLLEIVWREKDGPRVSPPARKGFGTRVLNRALAAEIGGDVDLRFEPEGAACMIRFDSGDASSTHS